MSQTLTQEYPFPKLDRASWVQSNNSFVLDSKYELAEWLWRVKKWEIVVELYDYLDQPHPLNGISVEMGRGAYADTYAGNASSIYASEREMIIPRTEFPGENQGLFLFDPRNQDPPPSDGFGPLAVGFDYDVLTTDGIQDYWEVGFYLTSNYIPGDLSSAGGSPSAVVFSMYGKYATLTEDPDFPITGSITITPTEWWPYAPTSGGDPVFDSSTGAQINPNVVID